MRRIKAEALPGVPRHRELEPRGALWVEVELPGTAVQVLTTHLGLTSGEKYVQSDFLLGDDWIGNSSFSPPSIVLGDLNDWSGSKVVRKFRKRLVDTHQVAGVRGGGRTFPSLWPLVRLDYIFAAKGTVVTKSAAIRTSATVRASDHLPVVAEIDLGGSRGHG